jgi:hypothetical protein
MKLKPPMPPPVHRVMGDEEYREAMREALGSVVTGTSRPDPCSDRPSQFEGRPCKKCGGVRRYYSNGACVACMAERARHTSNKAVRERFAKEYDQ